MIVVADAWKVLQELVACGLLPDGCSKLNIEIENGRIKSTKAVIERYAEANKSECWPNKWSEVYAKKNSELEELRDVMEVDCFRYGCESAWREDATEEGFKRQTPLQMAHCMVAAGWRAHESGWQCESCTALQQMESWPIQNLKLEQAMVWVRSGKPVRLPNWGYAMRITLQSLIPEGEKLREKLMVRDCRSFWTEASLSGEELASEEWMVWQSQGEDEITVDDPAQVSIPCPICGAPMAGPDKLCGCAS